MDSPQTIIFLLLLLLIQLLSSSAQETDGSSTDLTSEREACNGVFLSYVSNGELREIYPYYPDDKARQPFAFDDTATVLNAADVPLQEWSVHIDYPDDTILVSATSSVITDGSSFPYTVGQNGSKGVSFSGSPNTNLKTAIETAGDINQIQATIDIVGTKFGAQPRLPSNISLDNGEFVCPPAESGTAGSNTMYTCCTRNPDFGGDDTSPISDHFLPPKTGDLTISYDVIESRDSLYRARVSINNSNPLGRLDNWRLSWSWTRGEFVAKTQGAYTTEVDTSDCLFGPQGQYYKELDLSSVQNCQTEPTFLDLPVSMTNDTKLGMIPFCCRNGTILPTSMDPAKSMSAFELQVYKMPPDLNRTTLFPPENWKITGSNGALNPTYECGRPIRVSPSAFPDPSGLPSSSLAIASWQVVCNITRPSGMKPRCCVSFSGFYNESVVPCKTCACGCESDVQKTCSTTSPALLLPSEALLLPFDNRTAKALAWAEIKGFDVPNPLPCGNNCGVSINWHVLTNFRGGWTARMTLFNWEDVDFPDWFAAIVMDEAYDGFEEMYSFNWTAVGNKTLVMQGKPGLNYLIKMNTDSNPMDPGKLQSVMSFGKKKTPGIDDVAGGKFPSKVYFNGEECSLPDSIPTGKGFRGVGMSGGSLLNLVLVFVALLLMLMEL